MLSALTYSIRIPVLGGVPVAVVDARLEEALDTPYVLSISVDLSSDVEAAELLGADVIFTVGRAPLERRCCGVVRSAAEGDRNFGAIDGRMRLEVVPAMELLKLRQNTRMFQNQDVPSILDAVLGESLGIYSRSARKDLDASYPTREYCLQYQETDFDFVSRLMEEEGIHYTFEHEGDREVLVLRDANRFADPVATVTPGLLSFDDLNLEVLDSEPVVRFALSLGTGTTAVHVRDVDWTKSKHPVEATESGSDERGRTRESYEHGEGRSLTIGDYANPAYGAHDAARQATVRAEALATFDRLGVGLSRVIAMAPGARFTLAGHPTVGLDGDYLVTRVVHTTDEDDELERLGGSERYHNHFECVPFETPYRPARRAKKPRIFSAQTAVVTGPGEIHTDEWGRVTAQFEWDRDNPADETASCWLRVQQGWSGAEFGAMWIPRVGMHVVVQFVDGDPDRPVVTGCLYDGANPLPYDLDGDKTKSTIKSNSTPGGGGFNEVRFEDLAGSEEMFLHAQKDMNRVTLNNETITVGANQTITIGVDQTQTIGNNQTEAIGVDQTLTVGSNRSIDVGANFTETIAATSTITVSGHATETLDAGETQTVNCGRLETVNGGETRTVNGGQTETINGGLTQTINGGLTQDVTGAVCEDITGSHTLTTTGTMCHTVLGGIEMTTPATYALAALSGYFLFCPAGGTVNAAGGWQVIAPAGHTWIQSLFSQITGFEFEAKWTDVSAKRTSIGLTGLAVAVTGASAAATGMSVSVKGHEIGAGIIEGNLTGLCLKVSGMHLTLCGPKLHV